MTFPKLSLTAFFFAAGAFGVAVLVNTLLDQASASLARVEGAAPAFETKSSRLTEVGANPAPPVASTHAMLGGGYTASLLDPAPLPQAALALAPEPIPSAQAPVPEPRPAVHAAVPGAPARTAPVIRAEDVDRPDKLVAQIARMKATLNLSSEQEAYWRPVEVELRKIAQQQPAKRAQNGRAAKIAIDPASAQRLYWAAFPLILSLSAEQKQVVRHTARSMGLEQVASAL